MSDVCFTALTPLAFLGQSAEVFADKTAIVYADRRSDLPRVRRGGDPPSASPASVRGTPGDRVAYLCRDRDELGRATAPNCGAAIRTEPA
jgi:fatty-acyl-CoA synthase